MELDLGLDTDDAQPTVLEYARFYGLCQDYLLEHPTINVKGILTDEILEHDVYDPFKGLVLMNRSSELIKERLHINKEEACLLHSINLFKSYQGENDCLPDRRHHIRGLKQEVPVLRTDHELDMLNFGNTQTPNLTDLRIPLEPCIAENDEGLEWPDKYLVYPEQCDRQAKAERLQISKADILYLNNVLKSSYFVENHVAAEIGEVVHRRESAVEYLTPPLLPWSPPITPYIPSSPANHVPIPSDCSGSTVAEAKSFQEEIMATDTLSQGGEDDSNSILLEITEGIGDSSLPEESNSPMKRKIDELRVETPLTPPMFSESPTKKLKTVTFSEIPQFINHFSSTYGSKAEDIVESSEHEDVTENWKPVAQETKWRVEHERLSEADTIKRVEVPFLEPVHPIAPWDEYKQSIGHNETAETELHAQRVFLTQIKRTYPAESWHGISRLNRELPIEPFVQRSTRVVIDEKVHGQNCLDQTLFEMTSDDVVTSSTNTWKRDGLRLLEQEDSEEVELEPMKLLEEEDNAYIIDNSEIEMNEADFDIDSIRAIPPTGTLLRGHEGKQGTRIEGINQKKIPRPSSKPPKGRHITSCSPPKKDERNGSLMFGGIFSATAAMEKFIALHGLEVKPHRPQNEGQGISNISSTPSNTSQTYLAAPVDEFRSRPEPYTAIQSPGSVFLEPLKTYPSCSFIISAAILRQHHISRLVQRLYPNADFISRDYELPYAAAQEADLILSPSTGLILTTLQEIKQRALPGQADDSKIKKRLAQLQVRYERLIVLVAESFSHQVGEGRAVDARDLEAVEQFNLHAMKLESDITTRFVPGGAQALAQSIVEDMAKYGLPRGSKDVGDVKLLPDETNWELFLRRVGLNPFAAQVILALLKEHVNYPLTTDPTSCSEDDIPSVSVFGLQRFIMMSAQERIQNFQVLLGGSRILQKINRLLDQPWRPSSQ